jgi:hypothetical protein
MMNRGLIDVDNERGGQNKLAAKKNTSGYKSNAFRKILCQKEHPIKYKRPLLHGFPKTYNHLIHCC